METVFFKHICTRYHARSVGFPCWRGTHDREVDIIADLDGDLVPFEVKYRPPAPLPFSLGDATRDSLSP